MRILFTFLIAVAIYESLAQQGEGFKKSGYGFIENKGQIIDQCNQPNSEVKYLLNTPYFNVQLKTNKWSYDAYSITQEDFGSRQDHHAVKPIRTNESKHEIQRDFHRVDVTLLNANPSPEILTDDMASDYINYYTAGTPVEGITNVRHYRRITYKNIYPNIDVQFYYRPDGRFEYDFVVHPGGNPNQIRVRYDGQYGIELTPEGRFFIAVAHGKFEEQIPDSYLLESEQSLAVNWCRENDAFGFHIPDYDLQHTLVIDPTPELLWGTYFGGSASTENIRSKIRSTIDNNIIFLATTGSTDNLATSGSFQSTLSGGLDVILAKFSTAGELIYCTYVGGSDEDRGWGLTQHTDGSIYIVGETRSTSNIATSGTHQFTRSGGTDGFINKFNADGFRSWGTYFGGPGDDFLWDVKTDAQNNVIVTGDTKSNSGIATAGADDTSLSTTQGNVMVSKFSSTGQQMWGTYYGFYPSFSTSLAVNESGDIYIGGFQSMNSLNSNYDCLLLKYNSSGQRLWNQSLGGNGNYDFISDLTLDDDGNIYSVGGTQSTNGIATPGAYQMLKSGPTGGQTDIYYDGFISKHDPSGSLQWATYYGGPQGRTYFHENIVSGGYIYAVGLTVSTSNIASADVFQTSISGTANNYGFMVKFSLDGQRQWGSYVGGNALSKAEGIAMIGSQLFIAGSTNSTNGVSTQGAHQPSINTAPDYFLCNFSECFGTGQPTAQPTNFQLITRTTNTLHIDYTKSDAFRYLILQKANSYPTAVPVDGQVYAPGSTLGDAKVVEKISGGLNPATTYYYRIYAYNCENNFLDYLTTSPLQGTATTLATLPTAQPTGFSVSDFGANSFTINFNAATGNPSGYLVIRRTGGYETMLPVAGNSYTVGAAFDGGTVVYSGSGNSFAQNDLTPNTTYYYSIYAFNGSGNTSNYLTSTPLQGFQAMYELEPVSNPTNLAFASVSTSSFTGSFTGTNPSSAGYLVLRKVGSTPTSIPADGTTYAVGSTFGDATIIANGLSSNFSQTGLVANTFYHYSIYAYNGSGVYINYKQTSPLIGAQTTFATEPTAQPSSLTFSNLSSTGYTLSFNLASGTPSGYIAFRRKDSAPSFLPQDGQAYTVGVSVGDAVVSYIGSASSFTDNSLDAGSVYHYAIYAYNGTGPSINYRTTAPLTGNRVTLAPEPSTQANGMVFSNVQTSTASLSFTAANPVPDGYLGVRRTGLAPTGSPVDGITYSVGGTLVDGTIAFIGSGSNYSLSGLESNANTFIAVYAFNGTGASTNYLTVNPLVGNVSTLATEPSSSPSNVTFNSITASSFNLSFSAAAGFPTGYIAFRKENGTPVTVPEDGVTYSVNAQVGDARVVYIGSSTSFSQTGLNAGITYYYTIYAYNGSGGSINYRVTNPAQGNQAILANEPPAQPTAIQFESITAQTATVTFNSASADGYLVIRKPSTTPTFIPADGTSYALGQTVGDAIVVSIGDVNNFQQSNLNPGTQYFYSVFAYNGADRATNYRTANPLQGSFFTLQSLPLAQPTNLVFNTVSENSLSLAFQAASGVDGYLIVRRANAPPSILPQSGMSYLPGTTIGDGVVIAVGSSTAIVDAGLSPNTIYHYAVYSFNGSGSQTNYLTENPLRGNRSTLVSPPTSQPSGISFSNISTSGLTVTYNAASGSPSGYLVLRRPAVPVSTVPIGGIVYQIGDDIGSAKVAYSGNNLTFLDNGLAPGTTYHYAIFAYNGAGSTVNYLTSLSENVGNSITIPTAPIAQAATNVFQSSFTANWSSVAGASGYELDVSLDAGFLSFVGSYQGSPSTQTFLTVTGLQPGSVYHYRVRAVNSSGSSINSNSISAQTSDGGGANELQITLPVINSIPSTANQILLNITISGGAGSKEVKLFRRGITEVQFQTPMNNPTIAGNSYVFDVPIPENDPLGLEYYVEVSDLSGTRVSNRAYLYKSFGANLQSIPVERYGGNLEGYSIISIPYQLSDNLAATIFEPHLGGYDKSKWRLLHWQGSRYVEFGAGIVRIERGKGYWFNSRDRIEKIPLAATTAPSYNQANPFILLLDQGWNQIGNPFPFDLNWDDVLQANGNPIGIGSFRVFNPSNGGFEASNVISKFSGGFVFSNSAQSLEFSVLLKNSFNGGRKGQEGTNNYIWQLPISIQSGELKGNARIGMHSLAQRGVDVFDEPAVPHFIDFLSMRTYHAAYFWPYFETDIINEQLNYTWEFTVESSRNGKVELLWPKQNLEGTLLLEDPVSAIIINMGSKTNYDFLYSHPRALKIHYLDQSLDEPIVFIGRPYPNPSSGDFNINVFSPLQSVIDLELIDSKGVTVFKLNQSIAAYRTESIQVHTELTPGLYFYRILTLNMKKVTSAYQGKLLIK